jgi:isopenicillin-N N-acyltransferase-like protein
MSELPVLNLSGDPRERGGTHGEQLAEDIATFYDSWIAAATSPRGLTAGHGTLGKSEADYLAYGMAHVPAAREYAPDLVQEIDAIAEGAGMPFEKVFLLNCFDEAAMHGPALLDTMHGCTAFAATGRATVDGVTYVGQGWDTHEYFPSYLFRITSADQPDMLVFSHPGVLAGTGINEHGLCIVWNTLKANNARLGVPATFVVRKALQASELAQLVGNVISSRRANGMNFIAGDEDAAVDLELSPSRYHFTYSHGILHHANHFEAPEFLDLEADLPNRAPDTLLRSGRMRELLDRSFGSIDRDVLSEVLSDHAGGPGSICRHHAQTKTLCSVIYVPAEKTMWATNGNPCTEPFVEYSVTATAAVGTLEAAAV